MTSCILVDFDGTLTLHDTTKPLIYTLLGVRPWMFFWMGYYYVRILLSDQPSSVQYWKNRAIGRLIKGLPPDRVINSLTKYRLEVLQYLRLELVEYLLSRHLEGKKILVVTASPEFAVMFCLSDFPFEVIGTKFLRDSGVFLAEPAYPICFGEGKVSNIMVWMEGQNTEINFEEAFSDSLSDLPMMEIANKKVWVCDEYARSKIQQVCIDSIFWDEKFSDC